MKYANILTDVEELLHYICNFTGFGLCNILLVEYLCLNKMKTASPVYARQNSDAIKHLNMKVQHTPLC